MKTNRKIGAQMNSSGDRPTDERRLSVWLKPEDLVQFFRISLERRAIRFEIFHGMSDNDAAGWDNGNAYRFGYKPQGAPRSTAPTP